MDKPPELQGINDVPKALTWLESETDSLWDLPKLIEYGVKLLVWLDYSPESPAEVFGDRKEGFAAPIIFAGDTQRLLFSDSGLLTMTAVPDGRLLRFTPGLTFALSDLRIKRAELEHLAARLRRPGTAVAATNDLPTSKAVASSMVVVAFRVLPDGEKNADWWKERMRACKRYGLKVARASAGRGKQPSMWHPDLIARWLFDRRKIEWGEHKFTAIELAKILRRDFEDCEKVAKELEDNAS